MRLEGYTKSRNRVGAICAPNLLLLLQAAPSRLLSPWESNLTSLRRH